jgi:hypothetical protein
MLNIEAAAVRVDEFAEQVFPAVQGTPWVGDNKPELKDVQIALRDMVESLKTHDPKQPKYLERHGLIVSYNDGEITMAYQPKRLSVRLHD